MLLFVIYLAVVNVLIFTGFVIAGFASRAEVRRAREWVASFHGEELPPLPPGKHSMTFLRTVMPYYLKQGLKRRRRSVIAETRRNE